MTNFERYKDELAKLALEGRGAALVKGKPASCIEISCSACDFFKRTKDGLSTCERKKIKEWAEFEYKEPPKLNEQERLFCKMIKGGFLAKDKNGTLCWYEKEPSRENDSWANIHGAKIINVSYDRGLRYLFKENLNFDFVKWEDEEPWSVKEILKVAEYED